MTATTDQRQAETTKPRRRRHWVRWSVIGLVVLALIAAALFVWLRSQAAGEARAQSITRTVQAETSTQTVTVGLSGTLTPRSTAALNFSVAGTVTDVYVKVGDTVKKGQKLAQVDDSDLQDALDLAEANLDTAGANLDDVEDDGSDAAVTAAKAQVKSAKAAVSSAKDDLKNAVLKSTIAGTVASLDVSVGDVLGSSSGQGSNSQSGSSTTTAQVLVIATGTWNLEGTVGSTDLGSLKAGQTVSVTTSGATEPITGEVSSIGIVATSTSDGSATFPVVVELDGEHPDLYSGTTAQGVVTVAEYPDVLTIPTAAISTSDGKSVVNKMVDGQAVATEVGIGRVFGTATEITSGLAAGDEVQITVLRGGTTTSTNETGGGFFGGGVVPGAGGGTVPNGGGMPPDGGQFGGGNGRTGSGGNSGTNR